MKKIIFILFTALLFVSCDRNIDFKTLTVTEPALEVQVEGVPQNNVYPKVEGATVQLFNSESQLLATKTTDAKGKVVFTKAELVKEGKFTAKATKGTLTGQAQTAYMILNDGVTLLIVTIK